jgi:hypothetical protein
VLVHGQGNFAAAWMTVIPDLVSTYHMRTVVDVHPRLGGHHAALVSPVKLTPITG